MKKILAVALIAACALTAPGLPCYQALAGTQAKGPAPSASVPFATPAAGMSAPLSPNIAPIGSQIGESPAASAANLANPRDVPVLEAPRIMGLDSTGKNPAAEPASEPIQASPVKRQAPSHDDNAHALKDASTLAAVESPAGQNPFFDAAQASQKMAAAIDMGTDQERSQLTAGEQASRERRKNPPPPKSESTASKMRWFQFTLRGLFMKVLLPAALVLGALHAYTLRPNPRLASSIQLELEVLTRGINENYDPPYDFVIFLNDLGKTHRSIQNNHLEIDGGESPTLDVVYNPHDRGNFKAIWWIRIDPESATEEGLKKIYDFYLKEMQFYPSEAISFEDFRATADLYKMFMEARKNLPSDRSSQQEYLRRVYFDYINKVIVPYTPNADAPKLNKNANAAFAALRAEKNGNRDFYMNAEAVTFFTLGWVVYLLRGFLRRLWLKIRGQKNIGSLGPAE